VLTVLILAAVLLTAGLAVPQPAAAQGNELSLTSAQRIRVALLQAIKRDNLGTIRFWRNKGHWALYRRHKKCWDVRYKSQQAICYKARASWRKHMQAYSYVSQQLSSLLGDVGNTDAWMCIHSHEGDWEDGGWTYIGGLQMDWNFVHTYGQDMIRKYGEPRFSHSGPNGWLNAWTPREQAIVAERAHDAGRGYGPWPRTARMCGLI
jgi:hypothetical protein